MKAKSWASFGWASLTIVMLPRFVFTNVQVICSPALSVMFVKGLPSLQLALVRSQPATVVSSSA